MSEGWHDAIPPKLALNSDASEEGWNGTAFAWLAQPKLTLRRKLA